MVLFMDGCSHYDTAQLGKKWTAVTAQTATFTQAAEGRTDGCIKKYLPSNGDAGYLTCTPLFTQDATWSPTASGRIGLAIKVDDLSTLGSGPNSPTANDLVNTLLTVYYGTQAHFGVTLNSNGTLSVWRKQGFGTLLGSSVQGVTSGTFAYIEIGWVLSASGAGSVEIRSNETQILLLTGISNTYDVFPFGPPPSLWNSLRVLNMPGTGDQTVRICDIYVADAVAPNDDFLGDISVAYYLPEDVGAASAWTPTAGDNWECVDDVPPNDTDTPSISASTPGTRDSYVMQDVVGDPRAIQICCYMRKAEEGAAAVTPSLRIDGDYYDSPNALNLGSTAFDYYLQPMDVNPATGDPFTKAILDAAESGPLKSA